MQPGVLAVEGLSVRLAAHPDKSSILSDVSFNVAPGEVLGIVGESGSGKSVTALSILRLSSGFLTSTLFVLRLYGFTPSVCSPFRESRKRGLS